MSCPFEEMVQAYLDHGHTRENAEALALAGAEAINRRNAPGIRVTGIPAYTTRPVYVAPETR